MGKELSACLEMRGFRRLFLIQFKNRASLRWVVWPVVSIGDQFRYYYEET